MNKLLMALAVIAAAGTANAGLKEVKDRADEYANSYKEVETPGVRQAVGVGTTLVGNTIKYTAGALEVLQAGGYDVVEATVDSGECANSTNQLGEVVACGVDLGGDYLTIVAEKGTEGAATGVFWVTETAADMTDIFTEAFAQCSAAWGPVAGFPCRVVSVGFSATGKIVETAGLFVGESAIEMGSQGGKTVKAAFDLPASLLHLDGRGALWSIPRTIAHGMCTATAPLRWILDKIGAQPKSDMECHEIDEKMN